MPRNRLTAAVLLVVILLTCGWHAALQAQAVPGAEVDSNAEPAPELPPDPFDRRSPDGTVFGLLEALAKQDYARAAEYLDLSGVPPSRRTTRGPQLARQLQTVLDQAGWIDSPRALSSDSEGRLDDGLAPELDRFASVRTPDGRIDLLLERDDDPKFGPIWRVADDTLAQLPALAAGLDESALERYLPEEFTNGPSLFGVPIGQWLLLVLLAFATYLVSWLATAVLLRMFLRAWRGAADGYLSRFVHKAALPLRIIATVWLFMLTTFLLGISVIARRNAGMLAEVIGWAMLAWLVWRAIDTFAEFSVEQLVRRGQVTALSALRFFRRSAKTVLAAIAAMAAFEALGFDVTAGFAALGLGGLALALGAQKSVENLVGSLTLIADRPVRVGDFCKFGERTGTVEDIGMRSTRIRTAERSIVTVPNGEFSSLQIENFAHRDRFMFAPLLKLRYETSAEQIRRLLVELRVLLCAHPRVDASSARIRFIGFGEASLDLEVFCYVMTADFEVFLEVREELSLRFMDAIAASGTGFALPSQAVYLVQDPRAPAHRD